MTVIIPILNTKGGVGKTTTAICLATAIAGVRHVEVWDADPQGSATEWTQMAASSDDPLPFNVEVINKLLLEQRVKNTTAEYVFIDTPPGDPDMIDAAARVADLVILPSAPTVMDIARLVRTAASMPPQVPCVALLTRANKQTRSYREVVEYLHSQDNLTAFSASIASRQAIHNSFGYRPPIFYEYAFVADELLEAIS